MKVYKIIIETLVLVVLVFAVYYFKSINGNLSELKDQSVTTMFVLEEKATASHNCAISILQQTEEDLKRFRRMEADFVRKHRRKPWFRKFYWGP